MRILQTRSQIVILAVCTGLALAAAIPGPVHRAIRETFLLRVSSAHYVVRFNKRTFSPQTAQDFANQREALFAGLNHRLGGGAENVRITMVFDGSLQPETYSVDGTTIRANPELNGSAAHLALDPAADAEAMIRGAWGKPGSPEMGYWTALWLLGQRRGMELGMAAAEIEHRVGYKKVSMLLSQPAGGNFTAQDRALLGAAWLNEVSAFGGVAQVHALYAARVSKLDLTAATAALGTTSSELERKWQLWSYSYLAGMPMVAPGSSQTMTMPMNMPMPANPQ